MTCENRNIPAPIQLMSVGIVAYNEAAYLPELLAQLRAQDYDHSRIELVLVDSASTDDTLQIMEAFAAQNAAAGAAQGGTGEQQAGTGEQRGIEGEQARVPAGAGGEGFGFARVQVLSNPKRIQAAGWNVAIAAFTGDALVRVDAHASIPPSFVSANVAVLNEGEYVCGGMRPTCIAPGEETPWRATLHVAEESAFGSSVATYRRAPEARYVNSLFHACYRREVFDAVGGFNEKLLRTEDNDFHYRVREAGFQIKLDPRIHSTQYIRSSLGKMLKQKYGNGYWVGCTVFVQPKCLELYHFAPFAFICGIILMTLIGVLVSFVPFAVCAALYLALCVALAVRAALQCERANATMLALPLVFVGIHLSYGIGTLVGLLRGVFSRNSKQAE